MSIAPSSYTGLTGPASVTNCDPVPLTADRTTGKPATTTLNGLLSTESRTQICSETPGVTTLKIVVNGQTFVVASLKLGDLVGRGSVTAGESPSRAG